MILMVIYKKSKNVCYTVLFHNWSIFVDKVMYLLTILTTNLSTLTSTCAQAMVNSKATSLQARKRPTGLQKVEALRLNP
jgi:hypothetical protein